MVLNPVLKLSVVWPALTHRRLFNFYTGSETCSAPTARSIACLGSSAAGRKVLRVSASCWDGSAPRVLLHHPANSELDGSPAVLVPEIRQGNMAYHRELEAAYGTAAAATARGVRVHRTDGRIAAVEWVPTAPVAATAGRCDPREQLSRRPHWWADRVLEVPLGLSAAYTVQCPALGHEEVFLVPVPPDLYSKAYQPPPAALPPCPTGGAAPAAAPRPPANVVQIVLDSVSRPGMVRTLPKFTAWVRDFHRRAGQPGGSGHLVSELHGYSTYGFSTAGNMGPMLTGRRLEVETQFRRMLHNTVKAEYGDRISTSFLSGYCHDYLEVILNDPNASSGTGGRYAGIDHYLYNPLCHLSYTGQHSNYRGPFSIQRRCIAGRMVIEHLMNYTTLLLRQQMGSDQPSVIAPAACAGDGATHKRQKKAFYDLLYLVDGHEGTHYAITLIDDALTEFALRLEAEGFFADPQNVFIVMADHGSAMGHYFEFTEAGHFERTVPVVLNIIHPQVMERIDAAKGRTPGESFNNYQSRILRSSTPLDLHLTLSDLLGISSEDTAMDPGVEFLRTAPVSLFDAREAAAVPSSDGMLDHTGAGTLTYCVPDPLQRSFEKSRWC
ncbi:hypothetical protein STCU_01017 [Strigomonas culicis]|uniref:Uncharacterized protein n=1 Tax=Strigomonas culicis TaxID=28005 RepID=S9UXS7_9TRYP|nr:hypothetical protein STCU_01017 [Strigomonas culicis]|eukprot:EPY35657.1 hypothetical protein STCU_01017 [Strigomonas culicis]